MNPTPSYNIPNTRCLLAFIMISAGASLLAAPDHGTHPAILKSEFIYEKAPYPECHASTVVELPGGRIAAAWFGGTKEGKADVCIYFARLGKDGRWEAPVLAADGIVSETKRYPLWNPVLFQAPQASGEGGAPLFLFYKIGPNPPDWRGMHITSLDGGATWSAPERLADGLIGPSKNKPVVLADGSWLSPSEVTKGGWISHFEISRDAGKTWLKTDPVKKGAGFDGIQPAILFHNANNKNGGLQALCRTRQGVVAMTWSKDNGRTWTALAATTLPNPNSGIDAVTLADGRHLLVYNPSAHRPRDSGKGDRHPIAVAISENGLDWRRVLTLDTEPCPAGYAYPAVIQAADGLVHITYTHNRKRIKYVVLDPKKL